MYDKTTVLQQVSDHTVLFVGLGALALLCNWYYFFECARLAARDRCTPMALWATTVFIGHDGSYLLKFPDWFTSDGHWFPKLFWVGLIVTFSFEVTFFVQTVRFGREEMAPTLDQKQWTAYCFGALVTGVVFWAVAKSYLNDPIYLMTFLVTFGMCAPATIPLMVRRGSRKGVGIRQMWLYLGIGVFYVGLTTGILGGPFRTPLWIAGSLVCAALATFLLVFVHRLPEPTKIGKLQPVSS
ncbi:hypothetical protein BOO86_15795 [Mycobacterium sp. CBMA 234]|nr:hypothetical protein [Mycolicibacterium sp. CBMA 234]